MADREKIIADLDGLKELLKLTTYGDAETAMQQCFMFTPALQKKQKTTLNTAGNAEER